MNILRIDHIVLTVKDIPTTIEFYQSVLGMRSEAFGAGRIALSFGKQKINLHQYMNEFEPKADTPLPGSQDLCFITDTDLSVAMGQVRQLGIYILEGPVARTGATGQISSFYFRDPDLNLIEVGSYTHGSFGTE